MALKYFCDICGNETPARPSRFESGSRTAPPGVFRIEKDGFQIDVCAGKVSPDAGSNPGPADLCRKCVVSILTQGEPVQP